jgi:N,N'-diacetyllegionaminate synthase
MKQTPDDAVTLPGGFLPGWIRDECLIIGEVAQSHEGSLGMAHAFIDAIAAAGANAVKFQTHIAAAESTPAEPWRIHFSSQDASRYDYWRRMEFSESAWCELKKHAEEKQLLFLSSPFSSDAVELLRRIGVKAWKVASGEVSNTPMLERMFETRLPIIFSSGMSSLKDIAASIDMARGRGVPFALMQCTTAYPCPPEKVGLNLIPFFRERFQCPVGLSDHSGTIYPGLAAATLGIDLLEVHVTLSREMFGPDVPASITTGELHQLVEGVRSPVNKDEMATEVAPLRTMFSRSIVVRADLPAGTVLRADHLALKKPGTGLPPDRLPSVIGMRLSKDINADELIRLEDLE